MSSPFRLQLIVMGSSPLLTTHTNCANSPWLIVSLPKEKGTISGGSKQIIKMKEKKLTKKDITNASPPAERFTIDFQGCRMGGHACCIFGPARVNPAVSVLDRGDDQQAHAGANGVG